MKKIIAFFLSVLMLLSVFTACADKPNGPDGATSAVTNAAAPDDSSGSGNNDNDETTRIVPAVGDLNFNGYVFNVLTRGTSSSTWYSRDIYSESISGDIIGDAVYKRNSRMEEKYGFKVMETGSKAPATDAQNSISSGEDVYGMYCFKVKDDITSLLLKGYLKNLNNVSSMNLDAPYYDQNSRRDFSLAGKLYLVTGDLITMDNDATRCCLFNKALFKELSIANELGGSLYDLMADGTWTIEAMTKAAELATSDLNGDGNMDINDRYGMVSEQFNAVAFYNAAGQMIYSKDADDVPYFTANTEEGLSAFYDIITFLNKPFCRHYSNGYNDAIPQFKEGIVLFYPAQLADVPLLREMEFDFGIVPLPKFNADQSSYHSTVTTYGSNCIAIPSSVKDTERSAAIIEVLSCESMYVLTPEYYELNLKSKLIRDAESGPAIDIILSTACFELGYMWNWGSIYNTVCNGFNNNNPNLTAAFKGVEKLAKKEIENNIITVRDLAD